MTGRIMLLGFGATLGVAAPAMAQDSTTAAESTKVVTVRNISRMELSPGAVIVDSSGNPIGTVKTISGNAIVITDGNADYRLTITEIYAYSDGAADRFASRLPKAALQKEQEGGRTDG